MRVPLSMSINMPILHREEQQEHEVGEIGCRDHAGKKTLRGIGRSRSRMRRRRRRGGGLKQGVGTNIVS
jgi:hypothetical protein